MRTYYDPKRKIRHAVRDWKRLRGGGATVWLWCGWHTVIQGRTSRCKSKSNCMECLAKMEPH